MARSDPKTREVVTTIPVMTALVFPSLFELAATTPNLRDATCAGQPTERCNAIPSVDAHDRIAVLSLKDKTAVPMDKTAVNADVSALDVDTAVPMLVAAPRINDPARDPEAIAPILTKAVAAYPAISPKEARWPRDVIPPATYCPSEAIAPVV